MKRPTQMRDLVKPAAIRAKAILFFLSGLLSSALLLFERPTFRTAFLLAVAIWSFCRLYYFAFYVVDRYLPSKTPASDLFGLIRRAAIRRAQ